MDFLNSILFEHSALQATIIISVVIALGRALGKLRFAGVSLGVTFVFFVGILAGHLGLSIDNQMLLFAESFGLVLFVYELGLQVGPGFISSFQHGGMRLNLLGIGVIVLGTITALLLGWTMGVPLQDVSGILCGATTNTPALAAAQQTLVQMGYDSSGAALGCAVTYPLGVIGVIIAILLLSKMPLSRKANEQVGQESPERPYVGKFKVLNPGICGKKVADVAQLITAKFVISRIWRGDNAVTPDGTHVLQSDDIVLVVTEEKYMSMLAALFGQRLDDREYNQEGFDWNHLDGKLISKHVVITRSEINGRKLGALKLRTRFGINVSRVLRSGIQLVATPKLVLQIGDRLTIIGDASSIERVEEVLGGQVKTLREPNLASIFVGILLGLIIGSIPIAIPTISTPVKLGLAGGPIIAGILMGAYGPRFHLVTYTTRSANLMMRGIGLSLYLACLGLASGSHFFATVMRPEGLLWIVLGFLITVIPVFIMAIVAMRLAKLDFGSTCGMLCGAMANPMALNYVNEIISNDNPSVSYAAVYPLGMFLRVVIVQILLMVLL